MTSWTLDQLNALEAAIAQGALRVKYRDKEVQYFSIDEMLKVRDRMRQALGLNKDTGAGTFYPRYGKR